MHTQRCGQYFAPMHTGTCHTKTAVGRISSGACPSSSKLRITPSICQQLSLGSIAKRATQKATGKGSHLTSHSTSPLHHNHVSPSAHYRSATNAVCAGLVMSILDSVCSCCHCRFPSDVSGFLALILSILIFAFVLVVACMTWLVGAALCYIYVFLLLPFNLVF